VDRLILLVLTRWRMELRAMARSRARAVGLLLLLPGLLFSSLFGAFMAYAGVRAAGRDPELLLPALSLVATGVGLSWMLAPMVAGVAMTESHDVSRLLHFPVPVPVLVAASLVGNLLQPTVLAALPVAAAVAFAVSGAPAALPFAFAGSLLSLLFLLSASQVSGLLMHGISRRRRFQDVAVLLLAVLGFSMSVVPMLLFSGGGRAVVALLRGLVAHDVALLSPFGWGLRAAVHAGRGEVALFLGWSAAQVAAIAGAAAVSASLIQRIHRGEFELGQAPREAGKARAVMVLPGEIGAQIEKDLRIAWRNPATKATLFLSCVTPLFWLFVFTRMRGGLSPSTLLVLATFVGASAFGNDFAQEGRGLGLLLGFPVERWRVLVAKNLAALAFRLPGVLVLIGTGALLGSLALLPAAATIVGGTFLIAAGVGNYGSILFPAAVPRPGRNPFGGSAAGARGLGGVALGMLFFTTTLALAAPFVFLAWLPLLLGEAAWWLVSLPLAFAGAVAVYAMLVAGAAALFRRREPELLERILEGEAEA
jgi:hypothetical protein